MAVHAGGAALARLATIDHLEIDVLETIESLLPAGRHVDLDVGIAAVTKRLTDHRLATTFDLPRRASLHARLGYRLTNAGLHAQAQTAFEEAVAVYRRLVKTDDAAAFEPDLAGALSDLGLMLSELGRHDATLAATEEAVSRYRRLTTADRVIVEHLLGLAASLTNLGLLLSKLGRYELALTATEEAVVVYRRIPGLTWRKSPCSLGC